MNRDTYKNGSNFLPDQGFWRIDVIVSQKVQCVFHVLQSKCQADTNTERAMIINVYFWKLRAHNSVEIMSNAHQIQLAKMRVSKIISSDITHLSPLANADASVVVDISKFETTADLGAGAKPEATPAAMIKENTVANFIVACIEVSALNCAATKDNRGTSSACVM